MNLKRRFKAALFAFLKDEIMIENLRREKPPIIEKQFIYRALGAEFQEIAVEFRHRPDMSIPFSTRELISYHAMNRCKEQLFEEFCKWCTVDVHDMLVANMNGQEGFTISVLVARPPVKTKL